MKQSKFSIAGIDELPKAAKRILKFAGRQARVFAIYGEMGAGKTTLIKELCWQLGSSDNFSSPSYSIVNEYLMGHGPGKIYHIDLYRIKNDQEIVDLGIEEYINSGNYCFIEWPERAETLFPPDVIKVNIKLQDNMREISIFME